MGKESFEEGRVNSGRIVVKPRSCQGGVVGKRTFAAADHGENGSAGRAESAAKIDLPAFLP
jgi:hypothetical protein